MRNLRGIALGATRTFANEAISFSVRSMKCCGERIDPRTRRNYDRPTMGGTIGRSSSLRGRKKSKSHPSSACKT